MLSLFSRACFEKGLAGFRFLGLGSVNFLEAIWGFAFGLLVWVGLVVRQEGREPRFTLLSESP